ncbi:dockerin type I domain-containing protein [Gayadomonas joobiniege]|uniref:dockerin type I domain-containing protein n=1 Tax=Gayadomonas joobiniege TaxID=1234606 RepID=UPI000368EB0A|nr:dockerin type I domain-containing protein [Gayadomonas joobiniege]
MRSYRYPVLKPIIGRLNTLYNKSILLILFSVFGLYSQTANAAGEGIEPPPGNWTYCATAQQDCTFDGTKQVAFGLDGKFNYQVHSDEVYCHPSVFGDPKPGVRKHCWIRNDISHLTPPAGLNWQYCSQEQTECTFSGEYSVAYGRDGQFNIETHTDGVTCDNNEFGDAAPGKYKHCWVRPAGTVDPVGPEGDDWVICGGENATCYFNGYAEVAYGRQGSLVYGTYYNEVACTNAEFGDPAPGKAKYCWFKEVDVDNTVTLDLANPGQEITLMGSDMERSQFFLNNAANSQEISDWVFKDIPFDYARVSYDRKQELVEGEPNHAFYDRAILSMKMVQQSNPNVKFWATLKSDYDGYGTVNNLPDWAYTGGGYNGGSYDPEALNVEKYARFLADYLKIMSDNGVPISVLSVVKEWTQVVSSEKEIAVIEEIKRLLTTSDYIGVPEPEFSGPSTWGTKQALNVLRQYIAQDKVSLFKGISTHAYDGAAESVWKDLVTEANAVGLDVWHTETGLGTGPTSGVELDINAPINRFSSRARWYRAGMQGELFFEPWSRGVNRETRMIYFKNGQVGQKYRAYYIMKLFGNNAPEGSQYIPTQLTGLAETDAMAFRNGNKVILWLMNGAEIAHTDTTFYFNGEALSSDQIEQVTWTNDTTAEGLSSSYGSTDSSTLETVIEPKSVNAYIFTLYEAVAGDLDEDGEVTQADISAFISVMGTKEGDAEFNAAADFDADGLISRRDYSYIYNLYRSR